MHKTNASKKERKSKDKRSPKKALGTVQTINTKRTWKPMFYVWPDFSLREQLAHWPSMVKSISGGLFEIRFKSITPTVLQLQYQPRGNGSRLLRKDVKGNRARSHGKVTTRPKSINKSYGSLSNLNHSI